MLLIITFTVFYLDTLKENNSCNTGNAATPLSFAERLVTPIMGQTPWLKIIPYYLFLQGTERTQFKILFLFTTLSINKFNKPLATSKVFCLKEEHFQNLLGLALTSNDLWPHFILSHYPTHDMIKIAQFSARKINVNCYD